MPRASKFVAPALAIALVAGGFAFSSLIAPAQATQRRADGGVVAVVATPDIMNDLMDSDRFKPERDRFAEEKRAELEPMIERIQKLQQELQEMPQDDPAFGQTFQQFQQLGQQIRQRQTEINAELDKFTAGQILAAYKLVRSSAQAVADDLGYEYVMTSAGEDDEIQAQSVDTTLRQIMSRPVIMFPDDADITADVREDLNLE